MGNDDNLCELAALEVAPDTCMFTICALYAGVVEEDVMEFPQPETINNSITAINLFMPYLIHVECKQMVLPSNNLKSSTLNNVKISQV